MRISFQQSTPEIRTLSGNERAACTMTPVSYDEITVYPKTYGFSHQGSRP
jgi:hypothetical protein